MSQWFTIDSMYDPFDATPIDQSSTLDRPAGKHGFMKNVNGHWVFADGTPVRLVATLESPIAPDKKRAEYIARWLAKWGFTMVRFHPLEGDLIDRKQSDSSHLDPDALDRMDYFIDQLAKRGIYVRFSMLYYHHMKAGDGVEMAGKDSLDTAGITFFDPKIMQRNIDLEKAMMTHRNPYRNNTMYGQDPAVCQIEVTNEDSMFFYTIDGIPAVYKAELDQRWNDWLLQKYGSRAGIAKAWGATLPDGIIPRLPMWQFNSPFPKEKLGQAQDQIRFYAAMNENYFHTTKAQLRAAGVKQPISGSGWQGVGSSFYADIYSNSTDMDSIDRHHYYAGGPGGWRITPNSAFNDEAALLKPERILKLSMERNLDLPFTVSEWANVLPNQWRLEAAPLMALYGNSLNGWDAPMHFAHDMSYWSGDKGFTRFLYWMWPINEPSTLCQYPALSELIRRADVKEGPTVFVRNLSDDQVFGAAPLKDVNIRIDVSGIYEMSKQLGNSAKGLASIYAAAIGKTGIRFTGKPTPDYSADLNKYMDMHAEIIHSATGELTWNYGKGYVTANTPRTQAAIGFLTNIPVALTDCSISTSNKIASILVSSWDGKPLKTSNHILITAVGRTRNTGMSYSIDGKKLLEAGDAPLIMEGIKGTVVLNRPDVSIREGCTVTALSPYGYKMVNVPVKLTGGKVVIPMDGRNKAAYYEVVFR